MQSKLDVTHNTMVEFSVLHMEILLYIFSTVHLKKFTYPTVTCEVAGYDQTIFCPQSTYIFWN